ncbi:MAG: L-dopachrome tautomerase-related protein [Acidobacteriota bacterium]
MRQLTTALVLVLALSLLVLGSCSLRTRTGHLDEAVGLPTLEVLAAISDTRPGNVAVTPQGRVIITNHPLDSPTWRAAELLPDGTKRPFPNLDWADGPATGDVGLSSTIGIAADTRGVVWILDMGSDDAPPQLVGWDTVGDRLHARLPIPPEVTRPISFLQDFALDEKRRKVYIADMTFPAPGAPAQPAIVILDLNTGEGRRVLERSAPLMPSESEVIIDGSVVGTVTEQGRSHPWRLGINPIAIDPSFEWVYFATINGDRVHRIPAAELAESSRTRDELEAAIETYGPKPPCDGIAVDAHGRVFITDIQSSAVGVTTPGRYEILVQERRLLSWPDGFALGPDGTLHVTQNHLHAHPALNEGVDETTRPFHVVKLRPPTPSR